MDPEPCPAREAGKWRLQEAGGRTSGFLVPARPSPAAGSGVCAPPSGRVREQDCFQHKTGSLGATQARAWPGKRGYPEQAAGLLIFLALYSRTCVISSIRRLLEVNTFGLAEKLLACLV